MTRVYNANHLFAVLSGGGNVFKPELYDSVKHSEEFQRYETEELRKSEIEFERIFNGGENDTTGSV